MKRIFVFIGLIWFSTAHSEEKMSVLAVSGQWMAASHSVSQTAAPDICVAAHAQSGLGFRAQNGVTELRMSNSAWSLPTDVAGMVALNIKDKQFELLIGGNTDSSISAEVPDETALEMLALMDKSKVMTIVVGKAKPMNISLSGSSRALNAFRTCAHIRGNNEEAGSNPFK